MSEKSNLHPRNYLVDFCFIVLFFFLLYQCCRIFFPFAEAIFWAAILAFAIDPFYRKLTQQWKIPQIPAVLFILVLLCAAVIPLFVSVLTKLVNQGGELIQGISRATESGEMERAWEHFRSLPLLQWAEETLKADLTLKNKTSGWMLDTSRRLVNQLVGQAGQITKNLFLFFFNVGLCLWLLGIFLIKGKLLVETIYRATPLSEEIKRALFTRVNETLSAVIRGQLFTGFIQAILSGITFAFLGTPYPVLFGAITFLMALFPLVGAATVWVPMVGYLILQGSYWKAGILTVVGGGLISLVDNVLKPILIGEKVKIPYVVLFLGILGGIQVYGIMGIFIVPVILSVVLSFLAVYQKEYLKEPAIINS